MICGVGNRTIARSKEKGGFGLEGKRTRLHQCSVSRLL